MLETLLFFMQGIPETIGLVSCCLALARVKLRWKVIIPFACIMTLVIYLLRSLPVIFGLHTIIGILFYALFITIATKIPPSLSFVVSFAGFALLALLEVLMNELFVDLLKMEVSQLISDTYAWMLIGLSQAIIMIAIALLVSKYRKPLEGMWNI